MAEWLRRQIRNLMGFTCGGSNPSAVVLFELKYITGRGGLAQLEERDVSNVEAPGSKPGFSKEIYYFCF